MYRSCLESALNDFENENLFIAYLFTTKENIILSFKVNKSAASQLDRKPVRSQTAVCKWDFWLSSTERKTVVSDQVHLEHSFVSNSDYYLGGLLEYGGKFVVMKEVDHGMLNEEPRGDESQSRVLAVEAIMIGVKREMVEEEEPQPMPLRRRRVTANWVVLIWATICK